MTIQLISVSDIELSRSLKPHTLKLLAPFHICRPRAVLKPVLAVVRDSVRGLIRHIALLQYWNSRCFGGSLAMESPMDLCSQWLFSPRTAVTRYIAGQCLVVRLELDPGHRQLLAKLGGVNEWSGIAN